MKSNSAQFTQQLAAGEVDSKGYLLFGPNEHLVKKLRQQLLSIVAGTKQEQALRVTFLEGKEVAKDPQLLWDVTTTSSFFGGSPVVVLLNPTKELVPILKQWLASRISLGKLITSSGILGTYDGLRTLFSNEKQAVAVACYDDSKRNLVLKITAKLKKMGIAVDQSVVLALQEQLPNQVQGTDFYTGKLAYYALEKKSLSAEDVAKCFAETKPLVRLQQIADTCASGEVAKLVELIEDKKNLKEPPMGFVRWVARHFKILYQLKVAARNLSELSPLLKTFRPPLHFSHHQMLISHWRRWSLPQLETALAILLETEIIIKNNHPFGGETFAAQLVKIARLPDLIRN